MQKILAITIIACLLVNQVFSQGTCSHATNTFQDCVGCDTTTTSNCGFCNPSKVVQTANTCDGTPQYFNSITTGDCAWWGSVDTTTPACNQCKGGFGKTVTGACSALTTTAGSDIGVLILSAGCTVATIPDNRCQSCGNINGATNGALVEKCFRCRKPWEVWPFDFSCVWPQASAPASTGTTIQSSDTSFRLGRACDTTQVTDTDCATCDPDDNTLCVWCNGGGVPADGRKTCVKESAAVIAGKSCAATVFSGDTTSNFRCMPFDDTIPYVCNVDYGMDTTLWKCTAKASLVAAGGSLATGCSTANWLRATGGDDTCVNCDTTGEYWDYFSKKCVASASADSGDTTTSGFSKVVYTTASVILVAVLSIFA